LLFVLLMVALILVMYWLLLVTLDLKLRRSIQERLEDPEYLRRWTLLQEEVCAVKKPVPLDSGE